MTYSELSKEIEQLSYRDKFRLAQLLIQLARKEEEEQSPEQRQKPGPSDIRVDLRHELIGQVDRRPRHANGNAHRAKAVAVGRRDLNQRHAHRQSLSVK